MSRLTRRAFIQFTSKVSALLAVSTKLLAMGQSENGLAETIESINKDSSGVQIGESFRQQPMMFSQGFASVGSAPLCAHLYQK